MPPDLFAEDVPVATPAPTPKALGRVGAERAADHAERETEGWRVTAMTLFHDYALRHDEFKTQDVRLWAEGAKLIAPPPDARAWGAIAQDAARKGLVRKLRIEEGHTASSHGSPVSVWKSLVRRSS